jgi:hypothetical protein
VKWNKVAHLFNRFRVLCGGADQSSSLNLSIVVEVVVDLTKEVCHKSVWDRSGVTLYLSLDTRCRVDFVPVARCMRDLVGRGADVDGSENRTVSTGNPIRILPHPDLTLVIIPS